MEFLELSSIAMVMIFLSVSGRILFSCWIKPTLVHQKLRRNGFGGPTPSFPLGNITEMTEKNGGSSLRSSNITHHDIHSIAFPYFARWQKLHGKVFMYWVGTEPFLYIAEPEFLKKMSAEVVAKSWGKPNVFRNDRDPMFGNGLIMSEGDNWVRHRHVITPAFHPTNLKVMATLMVESTTRMLNKWATLINSDRPEIDAEREITTTAGIIIAKTSFGMSFSSGQEVLKKLRALQVTLFNSNRFVGVPFNKVLCPMQNLEAKMLGKEIDRLLLTIITERKKSIEEQRHPSQDLLGMLLQGSRTVDGNPGKSLTTQELVDECKTFFFGGHETTALAITWTLLLLATHPEWQNQLRDEIREVVKDKEIDVDMLAGLKKMGWVMNEVLRLYPSAPNVQRQARGDIDVNGLTIPNGTNIWIDVVSMHHDPAVWGEDVNEFKPERFKDDIYGGCKHKMGYLPFGFGGRMCIGRNLTFLEYKIVLTLILSRFSFTLSPAYSHSPSILLSLRPRYGMPIIFKPL
ncbi:cytokinin hydroxylase-like [Juglans microcarpa x Juglans regia]|uniref:cytokinin hydroxylase-like n=1 Tax=Juglans microcarpa x Juglans regia TaxID=2249226 RepID=UPI001B7F1943|nr:cytokinin hydroxylase-like [Juglans microcarpa x Juglans regia]